MEFTHSVSAAPIAPPCRRLLHVRQQIGPIHDENRFAVNSHIPLIQQVRCYCLDELDVILRRMMLFDEDFVVLSIPSTGPILVCPTKTKGQVKRLVIQPVLERSLQ